VIRGTSMENKKDILSRTYLVYMFLCVFALAILYKICIIQFKEGDEWKRKAEAFNTRVFEIEAVRGNIFDVNGNLLATSLPYYEVAVDINAPSIDQKLFNHKVDSLGMMLADLFKDKTAKQYTKILRKARNSGDRYVVLKRNVSYKNLQILKTFPIFKKGKRGGLVTLQTNKRELPFKMLAARTIGMSRAGVRPVGLEGAFDSTLMGISGQRLMQKIAGDVWRPINDENEVEPKNGNDLITTIDINIQDVAETALEKTLRKNNATHGCAILMEVKTGEIKAIANLTRTGKDSSNYAYSENLNYAVLNATEPGSTFKLPSLMAAIDEFNVSLDEKIQVGNGEVTYYNKTIKDSHPPKEPVLTVQQIFETSSNTGVAKIIMKYFSKNPQQYVDRIKSYHLNQKLGLSIPGEAAPLIKNTKSSDWSGVTLPQMSYGYETLLTPLQILAFYNAVANDGKMVKPRFEKAIINNGKTVKTYTTEVLVEQIAKPETIKKAKIMMEGVVQNGSGKGLNITAFKVGGKTGTAQIARTGSERVVGESIYGTAGNRKYQASFVGYFPADNPLYTCIVVVYNPGKGTYYGGLIAGPVFKEIAEKVYSSSLDFMQPINNKQDLLTKAPGSIKSKNNEMLLASKALNIPVKTDATEETYVGRNLSDSSKVSFQSTNLESQLKKGIVPNLNGLSAKDALFLLENSGFHVKLMGMGSVKKQSIEAGQKYNKGDKIILILS
jgi:cell division protein FtsI (penicillin-binding protein 3)